MSKIYAFVFLFYTNVYASNIKACLHPEERIIYCPQPESPRVTELQKGKVTLEFTVEKNGSTSNIKVLEFTGDERWISSAIKALKAWKYLPSQKVETKEQVFEFLFEVE